MKNSPTLRIWEKWSKLAETADYCREIGFSHEQTRELLTFEPVPYTGKLRSPKIGRSYEADGVTEVLFREFLLNLSAKTKITSQ